jgi:mevalonate kinase
MAFFYGNVYIAVLTEKLENSHVLMITKKPAPVDNACASYVPYQHDKLNTFSVYDEKDKAKAHLAVREYILDKTEEEVFKLAYSIEAVKMDVQRIKLLKQTENYNGLDELKETLNSKQKHLKSIHVIRRAKIRELTCQNESATLIG